MQPAIRHIKASDFDDILAIQLSAYPDNFQDSPSIFKEILEHCHDACFVAELNNVVCGYLFAYMTSPDRDDFGDGWKADNPEDMTSLYIHDLCIHKDYHGQKLGSHLYQSLENWALQNKINHIIGVAVLDAMTFWERYDFLKIRDYDYYGTNGVFMQKTLTQHPVSEELAGIGK